MSWFVVPSEGRLQSILGLIHQRRACEPALHFLHRIFPLQDLHRRRFTKSKPTLALHQMGRCAAPYVDLVDATDYQALVEGSLQLLREAGALSSQPKGEHASCSGRRGL